VGRCAHAELDLLHQNRPRHPRHVRGPQSRPAVVTRLRAAVNAERRHVFALVKEEGVFNTRVRLTGEAPKGNDAIARRGNDRDGARNRDYVHNYTTDDDDDAANAQRQRVYQTRGRETQYSSRSYYYRERPYYYRPYYGRGLFFPFGR
jgi:hypothetical protein